MPVYILVWEMKKSRSKIFAEEIMPEQFDDGWQQKLRMKTNLVEKLTEELRPFMPKVDGTWCFCFVDFIWIIHHSLTFYWMDVCVLCFVFLYMSVSHLARTPLIAIGQVIRIIMSDLQFECLSKLPKLVSWKIAISCLKRMCVWSDNIPAWWNYSEEIEDTHANVYFSYANLWV